MYENHAVNYSGYTLIWSNHQDNYDSIWHITHVKINEENIERIAKFTYIHSGLNRM